MAIAVSVEQWHVREVARFGKLLSLFGSQALNIWTESELGHGWFSV